MAFILKDGQQVPLSLDATDREGNAVPLTSVSWSASDPSLIEIVPDAAGDQSKVIARSVPGPGLGVSVISASFIAADGGSGSAQLDIDVVANDAAVFNITAGAPEDRPA